MLYRESTYWGAHATPKVQLPLSTALCLGTGKARDSFPFVTKGKTAPGAVAGNRIERGGEKTAPVAEATRLRPMVAYYLL
jgi:hypothetical protein